MRARIEQLLRRTLHGLVLATAVSSPMVIAQESVVIGAPLPLTGPLSPEGTKLQRGYDLWVEEVNKAGGITVGSKKLPVKIIYYDYQSNTPKAVQLAEKLVTDDKVNFLFSPFGSGATKAASAVSEKYGIPTLAPTASSVEVYDRGYKNLFGTFTPNDSLTEPLADLVKADAKEVKRVAILSRNDLYPLALGQDFEKSAKKRGIEVVYFDKYPIGALDHASAITQLRATKPDWIVITGYINDLILIRKQLGDQKVKPAVLTMINGPVYQEFVDATGALSNNVTTATWWHPAARYTSEDLFKSSENYTSLFKTKYKDDPDFTNATGSAVGVLLQLAIERAGSIDRDKVRAALVAGNFKTFFGPLSFSPEGYANSYVPPIIQVQNGKSVVLYPKDIKNADFRLGLD